MPDPTRFNEAAVDALVGQALRKIDRHGPRGTSLVTYDEIEAMACKIIMLQRPAIDAPARAGNTQSHQEVADD